MTTQNNSTGDREAVIQAVKNVSKSWREAFNAGDAAGCAACYQDDASMTVGGVGVFKGRQDIQKFWQDFIDSGAKNVDYMNTKIDPLDGDTAILTSDWQMNVGRGIITLEKWIRQEDNTWLLSEDAFEMTEKF